MPLKRVNNIKTGRDKVNMPGESSKAEQQYLDKLEANVDACSELHNNIVMAGEST